MITNQAVLNYSSLATGVALATASSASAVQNFHRIQGQVFEDVNYGGGGGRSLATSGGSLRSGVRIELYDASGVFVSSTNTDATGLYYFPDLPTGVDYTIRAVSSSVTSSRTGYVAGMLPTLTFVHGDVNHVGGEDPSVWMRQRAAARSQRSAQQIRSRKIKRR